MGYNDRCTGTADGEHTWVPGTKGGSDCTSCGAATVMSPRMVGR